MARPRAAPAGARRHHRAAHGARSRRSLRVGEARGRRSREVAREGPALSNGERGVRARIAHMMQRLYPSEPAKSRAEFDLVGESGALGGGRRVEARRFPSRRRRREGRHAEFRKPERRSPVEDPAVPSTVGCSQARATASFDDWQRRHGVVYEAEHIDLLAPRRAQGHVPGARGHWPSSARRSAARRRRLRGSRIRIW